MPSHATFALLSALCSAVGFLPFGYGLYRGVLRPHLFTWLIWTLVTGIVFLAQLSDGGGAGAWATATITVFCIFGLIASLLRGEPTRTQFDWICFILACIAMGLWGVSGTPRFSVILMTVIEALAFGPTVRKSFANPYSESLSYYILCVLKYLFASMALEHFTFDTALYPVTTALMAAAFTILLAIGRVNRPKPSS